MNMHTEDLEKRAETAAVMCDAQGFHATAQVLRALAEEMREKNWRASIKVDASQHLSSDSGTHY